MSGVSVRLSAFPKCYLDAIAGERTMTVFDWIEQARALDADGLEMYEGFFTSLEPAYLDSVGEAIAGAGFAMPMLCCSPDFTNPDGEARRLTAAEVAADRALAEAILRLAPPDGPFDAVALVQDGRR